MERFDICNESGLPTGKTIDRESAHREGILHRTAHVWIARQNAGIWQVLLQKRSMNKDSFPGLYDTSSAGHIPAGEEPLDSAIRELAEELGIHAVPSDLAFAGTFRIQFEKTFHGHLFRDNEFANVYVYTQPVQTEQLTLQESEVSEVRWFDLDAVAEEIRTDRSRFCVPSEGLRILSDYLRADSGKPHQSSAASN